MTIGDGVLLFLIGLNLALFAAFVIWGARELRHNSNRSELPIARAFVGVFAALVLGSGLRLSLQAHRLGWLEDTWRDNLLTWWDLAQALVATTVGIYAFRALRVESRLVRRSEHMIGIITTRAAVLSRVAQYQLTSREREVLGLIRNGIMDDAEIGGELGVTPSTAATHVRNIMRKTGLSDRRDLAVLDLDAPLLAE